MAPSGNGATRSKTYKKSRGGSQAYPALSLRAQRLGTVSPTPGSGSTDARPSSSLRRRAEFATSLYGLEDWPPVHVRRHRASGRRPELHRVHARAHIRSAASTSSALVRSFKTCVPAANPDLSRRELSFDTPHEFTHPTRSSSSDLRRPQSCSLLGSAAGCAGEVLARMWAGWQGLPAGTRRRH